MSTADEMALTQAAARRRLAWLTRMYEQEVHRKMMSPVMAYLWWRCTLQLAAEQGQRLLTYEPKDPV